MMSTFRLMLILLFTAVSQFTFAQQHDWDKLRSYFNTLSENDKFMGSVAVWTDNELAFEHAVGYADVENQVPLTTESRFRVGSISKTFTATLIFMAVEEGKLSLDQTIDTFFPDFSRGDEITIAMLLGHRSGIYNFTNNADYLDWNTQPKSRAEMMEIIGSGGMVFEPGSKAEYSNSNYVLLSYILEDTYNRGFNTILKQKITAPLGLESTYIGTKTDLKNNECFSYSFAENWSKEPETDMSIPIGAGAVVSTPAELIEFIRALFAGELVSEESLNQMKDIRDNYGMGLFSFPFNEKRSFGHTGGIDGFSSVFGYFPEEDVAFALTSNGVNYNTNEISIAVLSEVFGQAYKVPSFKKVEISEERLEQYVGTYQSDQVPLDIVVTREGNSLTAQATGQAAFPLSAVSLTEFEFSQAGIVMIFDSQKGEMTLKQGGGSYLFTKED